MQRHENHRRNGALPDAREERSMKRIQNHEIVHRAILAVIFVVSVALYVAGQVSQLFITLVLVLIALDLMLLVVTNDLNNRGR
jgi:hypothetical protein